MSRSCEKNKVLLSAMIDHELPDEAVVELNTHLVRCETCRKEYDELCHVAGIFDVRGFELPEDQKLDQIWSAPYSRLMKNTGLFLIGGGMLSLTLFGLYQFFVADSKNAIEAVSVAAILAGFFFLIITIVLNRLKSYTSDPYREVKR